MIEVYYPKQIKEGLIGIAEKEDPNDDHAVMMYLVIGEEKAALVDAGFGVTDTLRQFVESLTDKPVICLIGHGHPDHAGAAALFDEIYMNPADEPLLPVSLSYERRMGDVFGRRELDPELKKYCEEHIVMTEKLNYKPLNDGDIFDLGGKQLEVVAIPGHTQGSVAFVNRADNYVLSSDCFSHRTALVKGPAEKRLSLSNYQKGLRRFLDMINDDTEIYWGHSQERMPLLIPQEMYQCVSEILDGKTSGDTRSKSPFAKRPGMENVIMMEHVTGSVMLVYNAATL